jgi:hypothetical protein
MRPRPLDVAGACYKIRSMSVTRAKKKQKKKQEKKPGRDSYHLPARTEEEQIEGLTPDLLDAWRALRRFCATLGEQRIYSSHRSIMFARKTCYAFVRPKRSFLELNFFLPRALDSELLKKVKSVSKTRFVHVTQLIHSDQVEEPLTGWLREAFQLSG